MFVKIYPFFMTVSCREKRIYFNEIYHMHFTKTISFVRITRKINYPSNIQILNQNFKMSICFKERVIRTNIYYYTHNSKKILYSNFVQIMNFIMKIRQNLSQVFQNELRAPTSLIKRFVSKIIPYCR